jgi:hypothetical protein
MLAATKISFAGFFCRERSGFESAAGAAAITIGLFG